MNKSELKRFVGLSPRLKLSNRWGLGLGPVDMGRDGSDLWGLSKPGRIQDRIQSRMPRRGRRFFKTNQFKYFHCRGGDLFFACPKKRPKRKGTPITWTLYE